MARDSNFAEFVSIFTVYPGSADSDLSRQVVSSHDRDSDPVVSRGRVLYRLFSWTEIGENLGPPGAAGRPSGWGSLPIYGVGGGIQQPGGVDGGMWSRIQSERGVFQRDQLGGVGGSRPARRGVAQVSNESAQSRTTRSGISVGESSTLKGVTSQSKGEIDSLRSRADTLGGT